MTAVPKQVASSPLTQRVQFLETKGLTSSEIEAALLEVHSDPTGSNGTSSQVSSSSNASGQAPSLPQGRPMGYERYGGGGGGGAQVMMREPPPLPRRDWRDFFVGVRNSAGFCA